MSSGDVPHRGHFVSLYGGVARVARTLQRQGLTGIVLDLEHDARNDILGKSVQHEIEQSIVDPDCCGVGIDIQCSTWSLARRGPQGGRMPAALRDSDQYLMGLPSLKHSDQVRVRQGNAMYYHAMRVIRLCLARGIPGYLENPRTSRIFKTAGIQKLIRSKQAFLFHVDMCQFGTQWKKPTSILVWGADFSEVSFPRCCPQGKICSKSHKHHYVLSGAKDGQFRTHQAQLYPWAFARFIAKILYPPAPP